MLLSKTHYNLINSKIYFHSCNMWWSRRRKRKLQIQQNLTLTHKVNALQVVGKWGLRHCFMSMLAAVVTKYDRKTIFYFPLTAFPTHSVDSTCWPRCGLVTAIVSQRSVCVCVMWTTYKFKRHKKSKNNIRKQKQTCFHNTEKYFFLLSSCVTRKTQLLCIDIRCVWWENVPYTNTGNVEEYTHNIKIIHIFYCMLSIHRIGILALSNLYIVDWRKFKTHIKSTSVKSLEISD